MALVVIFAIFRLYRSKQRNAALKDIAHQLGFTYEGEDWRSSSRAPNLDSPLFGKGSGTKSFANILSGRSEGMTVNFFDYSFDAGRSVKTQTAAAFMQDFWLPTFAAGPRGTFEKLVDAVAHRSIRFDFNPEFSERFELVGPDENRIRALFRPGLLSFFEGLDRNSRWHFEASDFTLIIYRLGETVKASEFPAFVQTTTQMAKTFFSLAR